MTFPDFFIVNVALPDIHDEVHAGQDAVQLVVAGHGLFFAVGMISGQGTPVSRELAGQWTWLRARGLPRVLYSTAATMSETSRTRFFHNLDDLATTSRLVVDRPAGSRHPRVPQAVYPVDYGYLAGTVAADGGGVDVFRGSAAGAGVVGVFVTADLGKRDVEVKVLIDCTADEVERVRILLTDLLEIGGLLVLRIAEIAA